MASEGNQTIVRSGIAGQSRSSRRRPLKRGRPSCERSARITSDIISAAGELFLARGFDELSMEAVCEHVGITKTTLYSRFSDKRALMRAALEKHVSHWNDVAQQELSGLSGDLACRLRRYAQNMIVWGSKPEVRKFTRLAAIFAQAEARGFHRQDTFGYQEMFELVSRDIRQSGSDVGIEAKAPERIAEILLTLVAGRVERHDEDEPISAENAREEAEFLVDLLLKGKAAW